MLDVVDRSFREGRHSQQFIGELCRQFRNLMVMKIAGPETKLVAAGSGERGRAAKVLADFSQEDLSRYTQILLDLYRELQHATQSRFRMELGLLKLVYAGRLRSLEEVIAELGGSPAPVVGQPKPQGDSATMPARSAAAVRPTSTTAPKTAPEPPAAKQPKQAEPVPAAAKSTAADGSPKARLLEALREAGEDFAADAVEHGAVEESGSGAIVRPSPMDRTTIELGWSSIEAAAKKAGVAPIKLGEDSAESSPAVASPKVNENTAANEPTETESEAAKRALADPDVQAFQERFPGQIREIRNLREYSS
jgi:DNA polymerase-3 subunit gamma/tau